MSSSKRESSLSGALAAIARSTQRTIRSSQEIQGFLRRHGYSNAQIKSALSLAQAQGLIDDGACARLWAEQWARQGYAASAIRIKLASKGLPDEVVETALEHLDSDDCERARLLVIRHTRHTTMPAQRARLARTLTARGFEADVIEQVLT